MQLHRGGCQIAMQRKPRKAHFLYTDARNAVVETFYPVPFIPQRQSASRTTRSGHSHGKKDLQLLSSSHRTSAFLGAGVGLLGVGVTRVEKQLLAKGMIQRLCLQL
jgi:hypothetical protein